MPAYSKLSTFIESLRTGRTNITQTLETLLSDRESLREHPEWETFRDTQMLSDAMPQWLRDLLAEAGMSDPEIDHIDLHWPAAQKERVRQWIVEAIREDYPLKFRWELFDGDDPVNELTEKEGRTVIFKSPRAGIRISGIHVWYVHVGGVHVER